MKIQSFLLLLILSLIAVFAVLNWSVFLVPADLSLGVAVVQMPLGVVMLGLLVLMTVLFLVFAAYIQTSALLEFRRHSKELQGHRELAEKAEASRFTELRSQLDAEMLKLSNLNAESRSVILARIDQVGGDLRTSIEHSGNTLAAYIGEVDDRMGRARTPAIPPADG